MARKSSTAAPKRGEQKRTGSSLIYVMYAVLVALIVFYIISKSVLVGIFAFLCFFVVIALELRNSLVSEGVMKTARDIVIAVVAAVVLLWAIPSLAFHTSSPVDVVVSCSMLPVLHRGDLVILHGMGNASQFIEENRIPLVNVSQSDFYSMVNNMGSEFTEPFAYFNGNYSNISTAMPHGTKYGIGTYSLDCLSRVPRSRYAECRETNASLQSNLIKYNYSIANLSTPAGMEQTVYVSGIEIGTARITENYSNPIIIYQTTPEDYFSGHIIHRVFAAMKVGSSYYFLTKGDNNPVLDIESLNYPVNASQVIGYVSYDVPYLGFPALIIKGQVGSVPGCNQTIIR